ncbi:MAG: aspartate/glutamate racemase family protein [Thermodesulfobacteriota bacterium]
MIGIILLDTQFPRLIGDIGNPNTFPFPVLYEKVKGAIPSRVIKKKDEALLPLFIEAANLLKYRGARAITTSCGFLAIWQKKIAAAVEIPVLTSSLIQIPWVYAMVGEKGRLGVMTIDAHFLTKDHFIGVNAYTIPLVVRGMREEGEFYRVFAMNQPDLNYVKAENEVIEEVSHLVKEHPDIKALILECSNMSVFRKAIRRVIQIPLFDHLSLIHYLWSSLKDV